MDKRTPDTRAVETALARADVALALIGHQPLTDRKPKTKPRASKNSTAALARRLERLARQALPQALRHLRRDPTELWLLAHDPEAAVRIDEDRARKNRKRTSRARGEKLLPVFSAADARDVSKVLANAGTRERRRATSAGNARRFGADVDAGEIEVAGTSMASAAADLHLEAEQVLAALRAARLVDGQWHRAQAPSASCGDSSDDAESLPVLETARRARRCVRSIQTRMQRRRDVARAGQLELPCVPSTGEVYKARPRGVGVDGGCDHD